MIRLRLPRQKKLLLQIVVLSILGILFFFYVRPHRPLDLDLTTMPVAATIQRQPRRPNTFVTEYDEAVAQRFNELVERKADARDPQLVELAKALLDPPSENRLVKLTHVLTETPQSQEVDKILRGKRGGFFVECGALDGERSSNTMAFERLRGWTGLLVEVDPYFYTQLLGKSRRSWSINACLSPTTYVTKMAFKETEDGAGHLLNNPRATPPVGEKLVPCFPLETLLLALGQTSVDYFSLDVEGFELQVLRTIPFDSVNITTLSVEYGHGQSGKAPYSEFMQLNGYQVARDIKTHDVKIGLYVEDFIFVKNGYLNSTAR